MPRPSELLRQMVRELAAGGRQDALRELGRWLDQLNAQADPTTLRIGGGGGVGTVDAPANAPYLTVGAASGLSAYRQIAHDATLSHSDGGALGSYTLGVVANSHRHIEENIDETNYLVVDAGGRGDFTTVGAAITYLEAINSGHWTLLIRNGTYTEHITTTAGGYSLTVIGLGGVTIQSDDQYMLFGNTANNTVPVFVEFRNIALVHASGGTTTHSPLLGIGNGSTFIFRDCVLTPYNTGGLFAGNGGVTFYHCTLGSAIRTYTSGVLRSPGVSSGVLTLYNCLIHGVTSGTMGLVNPNSGNTTTLINTRILNFGTGYHISATTWAVSVARCVYDTAKSSGTITILDGDVPASALAGYVPTSRTISTTAPLSGGGDLSANRTLAIADAAADGTTKGAAAFAANDFEAAAGVISIDYANGQAADATHKGFLTAADWSTFNGKQAAGEYVRWRGSSSTTPSSPAEGDVWNDTTSGNVIKIYANGDWRTLN